MLYCPGEEQLEADESVEFKALSSGSEVECRGADEVDSGRVVDVCVFLTPSSYNFVL